MNGMSDICLTCKLNDPRGCGTKISEMNVVKGIGVVGCRRYEKDEKKARYYGERHVPDVEG